VDPGALAPCVFPLRRVPEMHDRQIAETIGAARLARSHNSTSSPPQPTNVSSTRSVVSPLVIAMLPPQVFDALATRVAQDGSVSIARAVPAVEEDEPLQIEHFIMARTFAANSAA
jgi:hypothetical protein